MTREQLVQNGYTELDFNFDAKVTNTLQTLIIVPLIAVYVAIYILTVDAVNVIAAFFDEFFLFEVFVLAIGIVIFMLIALFLKSLVLIAASDRGIQSLKFKFLTAVQKPYCTSLEGIKVKSCVLSLIVYIFFMAVVPFLTALLTRDFIFVFTALICTFFAAGDILMIFRILKHSSNAYIIDYESVYLFSIYSK